MTNNPNDEMKMQLAHMAGGILALTNAAAILMGKFDPSRDDLDTVQFLLERSEALVEDGQLLATKLAKSQPS